MTLKDRVLSPEHSPLLIRKFRQICCEIIVKLLGMGMGMGMGMEVEMGREVEMGMRMGMELGI